MKIIDCYWEQKNLGKKVVEIAIDSDGVLNKEELYQQIRSHDYIVVKVPVGMTHVNFELSSLGFTMIETQIDISKRYKNFNFNDRLVKNVYPHASSVIVRSKEEISEIVSRITPDMFSTDRVYLDNYFEPGSSANRYINWIWFEYERQSADVAKLYYDDINVGYGLTKVLDDGTQIGVLGGIYEEYQNMGLGLMTAAMAFIVADKWNIPFKVFRTSVSSNNPYMWQFYNYLGFKVDRMKYVFVKHNDCRI